jgi:hypothetical protein
MFVRIRQARSRIQVSVITTRRVDGKVRHEHVAGLGSIGGSPSVADRVDFWRQLHERLGRLGNRVDATVQAKILGEVHARIPMPTIDEVRSVQLENAEAEERVWTGLSDMHFEMAEGQQQVATLASQSAATTKAAAETARTKREEARGRIERLKRGEAVSGGLNKAPSFEEQLRQAGWTDRDLARCRMTAAIGDLGGFEELLQEIHKRTDQATDAARRAVYEKLLLRQIVGSG